MRLLKSLNQNIIATQFKISSCSEFEDIVGKQHEVHQPVGRLNVPLRDAVVTFSSLSFASLDIAFTSIERKFNNKVSFLAEFQESELRKPGLGTLA